MAKRKPSRRIVIDDIEYRWDIRTADEYSTNFDWLGVMVVPATSPTGKRSGLTINLRRPVLVLPSYVRKLILEARAAGWDPFDVLPRGFQYTPPAGPYADEPDAKKTPKKASGASSDPSAIEGELIAAIRRAPADDDSPYLVYADWLLDRGDEHGEYIHLACGFERGALSPAQADRHKALMERYNWEWLGAIADVTSTRIWKRGLLEEVGLDRRQRGVVNLAIGDPKWRTVRRINARAQYMADSDIVQLVGHPVLSHLEALTASTAVIEKLIERHAMPDVEELIVVWGSDQSAPKKLLELLPSLVRSSSSAAPRRLRRLTLVDSNERQELLSTLQSICGDHVLSLSIVSAFSNLPDWQELLIQGAIRCVQELCVVGSLPVMFEHPTVRLTLRRGVHARPTDLTIDWQSANYLWSQGPLRLAIREGVIGMRELTRLSASGPVAEPPERSIAQDPALLESTLREWIVEMRERTSTHVGIRFDGRFASITTRA